MTEVLLRHYVEEMRAHLGEGNFSQVLALGNHILCFYPKHLETYQILAETNLEMNEMDAAADLFSRVRSADPENPVALFGLAIIYEHHGQIDEAIWHLEQAFEIQSSNAELRKELLRLYEAHDGAPRGRLKLTPGALARLHARQGLYAQAIQEFRAILRQSDERLDLQAALAEALYREGRKQEAAQVSQSILQHLPYCLKANLLLGALWAENGVSESQALLVRALALDPERVMARDLQIDLWDQEPAPTLPEYKGPTVSAVPEESSEWRTPSGLASPSVLDTPLAPVESEPLRASVDDTESFDSSRAAVQEEKDASATGEREAEEAVPWLQNIYHSSPAEPTGADQPPPAENEVSLPWLDELYAGEEQSSAPPAHEAPVALQSPAEMPPAEPPLPAPVLAQTEQPPDRVETAAHEPELEQSGQADEVAQQPDAELQIQPEETRIPVVAHEAELAQVPPSSAEIDHDQDLEAIARPSAQVEPEIQAEQPAEPEVQSTPVAELPVHEMHAEPVEPEITTAEPALAVDITPEVEPARAEPVALTSETLVEADREPPLALEFLEEETRKAAELEPLPAETLPETEGAHAAQESVPPEPVTAVETETRVTEATVQEPVPAEPEISSDVQVSSPAPEQPLPPPPMPTPAFGRPSLPTFKPTIVGSADKLPAWIRASLTPASLTPAAEPPQTAIPPAPPVLEDAVSEPVAEEETRASSESPPAETVTAQTVEPESTPQVTEMSAAPENKPAQPETVEPLPAIAEESAAPTEQETAPAPVAQEPPLPALPTPPEVQAGPAGAAAEAGARLPSDPESLLARARELRAAGNTAGALDYYERAMQRGPRMVSTIIAELEELVKDPDAPLSSHRLLGDAYAMAGRFKEALVQYRLVLNK